MRGLMTIWHFKGELLERDGDVALYRYFPDHVMAPAVTGVFRVHLLSFEVQVIEYANAEARGLVSNDEHCVSALVNKIRKAVATDGAPPDLTFFIA